VIAAPPAERARLQRLLRIAEREQRHVRGTAERLFAVPFTAERVGLLDSDPALAERVDAFVARFARLQDTLGDKLLPALLVALGETPGAALDNLDRAERLGWIASSDVWMAVRRLRNQMIHEYVEDPAVLANALQQANEFLPTLMAVADECMRHEVYARGWAASSNA
jgi:hypothetical protein